MSTGEVVAVGVGLAVVTGVVVYFVVKQSTPAPPSAEQQIISLFEGFIGGAAGAVSGSSSGDSSIFS
jgi:hypothetical protein